MRERAPFAVDDDVEASFQDLGCLDLMRMDVGRRGHVAGRQDNSISTDSPSVAAAGHRTMLTLPSGILKCSSAVAIAAPLKALGKRYVAGERDANERRCAAGPCDPASDVELRRANYRPFAAFSPAVELTLATTSAERSTPTIRWLSRLPQRSSGPLRSQARVELPLRARVAEDARLDLRVVL